MGNKKNDYYYSDEEIKLFEKLTGHKLENVKKPKKKKYLYTDEELKHLEKITGHKIKNMEISNNSDANKDELDMYIGDGVLSKDDLEPEELDDLLIPEEEWDDDDEDE